MYCHLETEVALGECKIVTHRHGLLGESRLAFPIRPMSRIGDMGNEEASASLPRASAAPQVPSAVPQVPAEKPHVNHNSSWRGSNSLIVSAFRRQPICRLFLLNPLTYL
jgi:hypothetical protein